jgi:hypothetical protein
MTPDERPQALEKNMARTAIAFATIAFLAALAAPSLAQESRWGAPDEPTVKFMIASEAKWANAACSTQAGLGAFIADDYQGTSTTGSRYPKADAIADDPKKTSRDCKLGDVKVRFFGDATAVAYGSESRMQKAADGTESRRCQVWTDTWLKRGGKWQIVAAQDTIIPCDKMRGM